MSCKSRCGIAASTATSNAPSGGQNKRRLKHLPTDLIAYLDGYLDEIAVGHFVLGDILQNTNCFRSGLFPIRTAARHRRVPRRHRFEDQSSTVSFFLPRWNIWRFNDSASWRFLPAGRAGDDVVVQRTAGRSADMKSTSNAKALRPAAMACEYSHWRRSSSQFSGRTVQFRVA